MVGQILPNHYFLIKNYYADITVRQIKLRVEYYK